MKYLSLCSGIEAASVAWESLGWKPVAFCEIEPFPSAVLAHHYPDVPNLRDMTTWREWDADILAAADVLCAGTPCQSFSVAGARRGLDDERGNLTLEFVRIANEVDKIRQAREKDPAIIVWENVPGVLSSRDNAFGCFLAGLAGESEPLVAPGKRWENAGVVLGPQRTVAWRTLDAQYFGLAQRRKRVFVVASAGTRFNPCEVLFESEGVRRDTAPSREAREGVAATITSGAPNGGPAHGQRSGHAREANLIPEATHSLRGEGFDASEDGTGRGTPLVPETVGTLNDGAHNGGALTDKTPTPGELSLCLNAGGMGRIDAESKTLIPATGGDFDEVPAFFCHRCGEFTSVKPCELCGLEDSTVPAKDVPQYGTPGPVAFQSKASAHQSMNPGDVAPSLDVAKSGGTAVAVAVDVYNQAIDGDCAATLTEAAGGTNTSGPKVMAAGFKPNQSAQAHGIGFEEEMAPTLEGGGGGNNKPTILNAMQVRRLTPRECERLQGFPDDYTLVPYRKKPADQCPDGPRYKALGNSWAVPVVRWIGARIQARIEAPSDD